MPEVADFQFLGSFRYGPVFDEAIRLVASKRVDLRPLISRVFPLREANAALTLACAKNEAVKVQIDLT
jgi:L-idonate 5-dehydrogenase